MLCETLFVGKRWWFLSTSHYFRRLLAGECCIHALLAKVSHSLSKQPIMFQLCIVTVLINFLNMCYIVMSVVSVWICSWHLFCKHSLNKLWRFIDPWKSGVLCSVQSGLELWPFYLYLHGAGIKVVCHHALSLGFCFILFCYLGEVGTLYTLNLCSWVQHFECSSYGTFFNILKIYLFLFHVYGCFAWMYVCAPCVCVWYHQRPEEDKGPLGLELQLAVSHHVWVL